MTRSGFQNVRLLEVSAATARAPQNRSAGCCVQLAELIAGALAEECVAEYVVDFDSAWVVSCGRHNFALLVCHFMIA